MMVFIFSAFVQSAHGQAVKILPLGDSWTSGHRGSVSYRYDLWFDLADAGFDVDFVGDLQDTYHPANLDLYPRYLTDFDRDHSGHWGYRTDALVSIAGLMAASRQPDVVLLWAGGNDIAAYGDTAASNVRSGLGNIIDTIRSSVPGVTIVLGKLAPFAGRNSEYIESVNETIAKLARDLDTAGSPVILVDHYAGFEIGSMTQADQIHHNRTGEAWIAANWFDALASILGDAEPFQINAGHSGAWFNPETAGQGQLIDVEPAGQFMFVSWFTFTDAASANPGEQHWLTAQGNYSADTAELTLYETLGGRFDDPQAVSTEPVGEVTVRFTDCGHGQLSYTIDTWGLQGSFPLVRAIPGSENVCQDRSGNTIGGLEPNDGWDGAWFDPATPGQGFLVDVHPNPEGDDFIFVAWFTYGENTGSGQRWLTAQGPMVGSIANITLYETTGGQFDDPQSTSTEPVGSMAIDFTDCSNALLTYSLPDEAFEGAVDIIRTIPGTEALCQQFLDREE